MYIFYQLQLERSSSIIFDERKDMLDLKVALSFSTPTSPVWSRLRTSPPLPPPLPPPPPPPPPPPMKVVVGVVVGVGEEGRRWYWRRGAGRIACRCKWRGRRRGSWRSANWWCGSAGTPLQRSCIPLREERRRERRGEARGEGRGGGRGERRREEEEGREAGEREEEDAKRPTEHNRRRMQRMRMREVRAWDANKRRGNTKEEKLKPKKKKKRKNNKRFVLSRRIECTLVCCKLPFLKLKLKFYYSNFCLI